MHRPTSMCASEGERVQALLTATGNDEKYRDLDKRAGSTKKSSYVLNT